MRAYFLSDLHLGAPYFKDARQAEMRVVDFLDSIKDKADVIYLVGDILDYWYEYRYVVPRGYVRFFGKLAELTDSGVRVVWFIGNHDIWIFDYLPSELGVEVVDGALLETLDGNTFYIAHGDGVGRLKPSFKFMRKLFRNSFCQKLFSGIHPRWTIPFALNWSGHSRKAGGASNYGEDAMLDNLLEASRNIEKSASDRIDYFIYGHLHVMSDMPLYQVDDTSASDSVPRMLVLGDWISHCSYAVWNGATLELKKWNAGEL